jgi:hypothetical protein
MKQHNFGVKSLGILLEGLGPLTLEPASHEKGSAAVEKMTEQSNAMCLSPLSKEQVRQILDEPARCQLFWEKHLPQIPPATELSDLSLRTRTYNCLSKLIRGGVISRPSGVAQLTVGQMMRTKNFGTTSMVDLLRSLDLIARYSTCDSDSGVTPDAETLEPLSSNLSWAADRLSASRTGRRVRANDPRMRHLTIELLYLANNSSNEPPVGSTATLTEIARRLVVRTRDPRSPSEAVDLIDQIRVRLSELIRKISGMSSPTPSRYRL